MPIQLPEYTNTTVANTSGGRGISLDSGVIGQIGKDSIAAGVSDLVQVNKTYNTIKATGNAADKFNDWKRRMDEYEIELKTKDGSEASKIDSMYDSKSNRMVGEYKFDNGEEQVIFNEKMTVAKDTSLLNLKRHKAEQAVMFNKKQQAATMAMSLDAMAGAAFNGDMATLNANLAQYAEANRQANRGMPQDYVTQTTIEGVSNGLSNSLMVMGQNNPAGALKAAKFLKESAGGNGGHISEIQYQAVLNSTRDRYIKDIAKQSVNSAIEHPSVKYKTVGEMIGEPVSVEMLQDSEKGAPTANVRPIEEVKEATKMALQALQFGSDPYFGDISEDMNTALSDTYDSTMAKYQKAYDAQKDLLVDKYTNAVSEDSLRGIETEQNAALKSGIVNQLYAMGDYTTAKELIELSEKDRETDDIVYNDVDLLIENGDIKTEAQLLSYKNSFNNEDYESLKKKIRSANMDAFKSASGIARSIIKGQINKDWSETRKQTYEGNAMKVFNRMYNERLGQNVEVDNKMIIEMASLANQSANKEMVKGGYVSESYETYRDVYKSVNDITFSVSAKQKIDIQNAMSEAYFAAADKYGKRPPDDVIMKEFKRIIKPTQPSAVTTFKGLVEAAKNEE